MSLKKKPKKKKNIPSDYIEIVDSMNRPLGVLSREDVHRQGLFHRSVLVLAYDLKNRLLIQKRHPSKKIYPGRWDLSATGHVLAGESTVEAAYRELEEEVGIVPSRIRHIITINGSQETNFEFVYLYSAGKISSPPSPNPLEVEDITFIGQDDMQSLVREFPDILTPGLVHFWRYRLLFSSL